MSNYDLFHRDFSLNLGGVRIASRLFDETRRELGLSADDVTDVMRVVFSVTKTTKKEPNKADITVSNLREEHRILLQERSQEVVLEAGYIENTSVIFRGELSHGQNVYDGTTWATYLQTADGEKQLQSSRINKSLSGNVSAGDALQELASALGLKPGNIREAISRGSVRDVFKGFSNGIVLSGKTEQQLHKLAKSMGLSISIQDGQLMMTEPNQFIGDRAILLKPGTGLIGSPQPGENGYINIRCNLQPKLQPLYRVKVESELVNGFFRIEKAVFKGDTWGNDWYVDLECKPL